MGLFDKKFCDICGEKIGLLGNRKLEDGNLCKNCAKKLSPWFDERRHSTVEQIKQQLNYREENKSKVSAFRVSRTVGNDSTKLYIDDSARKFAVHRGNDFASGNPDILDFSQVIGCDLDIRESRSEKTRTVDGRSVSYNPPRYEYSYDLKVTLRVDHPYFDDMQFDLNSSSVHTGETQMNGGGFGAWNISRAGSLFGSSRGMDEYNNYVRMGNELKEMIDSWKNSGYAPAAAQNGMEFRLGSANPIPCFANIGGETVMFELVYSCTVRTTEPNPTVVQNLGGIDSFKNLLTPQITLLINDTICTYSGKGVSVAMLPSKAVEIARDVKASLDEKWTSVYRMSVESIVFESISLTDDSRRKYEELSRMQAMTGGGQQTQDYASQEYAPQPSPAQAARVCPFCDSPVSGKFCSNCGAKL